MPKWLDIVPTGIVEKLSFVDSKYIELILTNRHIYLNELLKSTKNNFIPGFFFNKLINKNFTCYLLIKILKSIFSLPYTYISIYFIAVEKRLAFISI